MAGTGAADLVTSVLVFDLCAWRDLAYLNIRNIRVMGS
jgi:hypothetical protein